MIKKATITYALLLIILVTLFSSGCGKASMDETTNSNQLFSFPTINETISNGELELVVTSAKPIKIIDGQEADSGCVFLAVIFEYKNIATYSLNYSELPMVGLDDAEYKKYESYDDLANIYGQLQEIDLSVLMDPLAPNESRQDVQIFMVPIDVCNNQYLYLTFDVFTQEIELDIHAR